MKRIFAFPLIFINKNLNHESLKNISNKIPKQTSDFLYVTIDENRIYVIISTNNEEKVKQAIKILKEQKIAINDFYRDL